MLQGECHVSFRKECAEILKTLLTTGRLGWTAYRLQDQTLCAPTAHRYRTRLWPNPQSTRVSSISRSVRRWHTARRTHASSQILLRTIQHLVTGTSIHSPRRRPSANVCCCAERLRPKGFRYAQMVEHGALGTGEYSNCLFCYTIRRTVVRDWRCSLVRRARRCRASCPSIIRACCPS